MGDPSPTSSSLHRATGVLDHHPVLIFQTLRLVRSVQSGEATHSLFEEDRIMLHTSTAFTHIGRRAANEDAYYSSPQLGLHVVSDGMGGYEGGEVASRLTVETIGGFFAHNAEDTDITWPWGLNPALSIEENMAAIAIKLAHERVASQRSGKLGSMGSTVALIVILPHKVVVAHVGDSRVYRLRDGVLEQLTEDHSLYNQLKGTGTMDLPPEEEFVHKNVITRAIGLSGDAHPDVASYPVQRGDRFLLCTDGLSGKLSAQHMTEILQSDDDLDASCQRLVLEAFERGSLDNITAVIVSIPEKALNPREARAS